MKKMLAAALIVVVGIFMLSASSVMAQEPCNGNFDCDYDVDASDVIEFLNHFGRSQFFNPCPLCQDSLCPCSSTVPKTGQTTSYATGDDGDLEKGLIWPNPRFTDNLDGTVTDNLTGLIWLKEANCIATNYPEFDNDATPGNGMVTWQHAFGFILEINVGIFPDCGAGNTDWRLPNRFELESLLDMAYYDPALPDTAGTGQWSEGNPFTNVQSYYYWSSTTYEPHTIVAWIVHMGMGFVNGGSKSDTYYVWPVRDPL
jgi:hypothetical protein